MIPGPKALLAAVALLISSAACSLSQPPRIQDALFPPMAVQDPLFKRSTGKIYLLPQGLWTLTLDDPENAFNTMQPGELVSFDTNDETSLSNASLHTSDDKPQPHVFAIVSKKDWGFLLQRLDNHPISRNTHGSLAPVSNLKTYDICTGTTDESADLSTHECLTQNPLTRFDIYTIASEATDDQVNTKTRLTIQNQANTNTLGMPLVRQAQIYIDANHTPKTFTISHNLPDRWIAIPSNQPALTPAQISIVSDQSCSDLENSPHILNGLTLHHTRLDNTLPLQTHPLEVEAAAFQHAADSMIWCTDDKTNVVSPAIHHPLLTARSHYILGTSILGLRPIQISANPEHRALLAQISALSSRNHIELADFALETLLNNVTDVPPIIQQLAIQSMQLTASAGRPEAALRHGWIATQNTWNREGDPLYMLGQAAAFAAFDLNAEYTQRIQKFSQTLQSANDPNLVAWLIYNDFRHKIATGAQIPLLQFEEIDKNLANRKLDTWAIAIRALALQQEIKNENTINPAAIEILQKAFHDRKMAPIWTAYLPQNTAIPLDCPSSNTTCTLDSFGRRLLSAQTQNIENLINQLRTTPRVELRSNFRIDHLNIPELNDQPARQARLILAAFPLLSAEEKTEILPQLSQTLANTINSATTSTEPNTCLDLTQIQATGRELSLRSTTPDHAPHELATARNATWLATKALPAACQSLAKFEEVVLEYTRTSGAQPDLIIPFFDNILLRKINTEQDNAEAIRILGRLTTELNNTNTNRSSNNEPCLRFNLALAAALAKSGQLEAAQEHLLLSGKCAKPDDAHYSKSYNLILNYINYERSGRWPKNQPPQSPTAAEQPQNNRCAPLQTDAFDIFQHLDPQISQLATRFQLPAPEPSTEFLQIRLASTSIAQGEAAYQVARRTLAEASPHLAAKLLLEARQDFISSSHTLGLARINFLEQTIFDQNFTTFTETPPSSTSPQPQKAQTQKQKTPKSLPEDISQISPSQLPNYFRNGFARPWLEQFDAATPEQRAKTPAHLLISASMLVEELPQTLVRLQSLPDGARTPALADLCTPPNINDRLIH